MSFGLSKVRNCQAHIIYLERHMSSKFTPSRKLTNSQLHPSWLEYAWCLEEQSKSPCYPPAPLNQNGRILGDSNQNFPPLPPHPDQWNSYQQRTTVAPCLPLPARVPAPPGMWMGVPSVVHVPDQLPLTVDPRDIYPLPKQPKRSSVKTHSPRDVQSSSGARSSPRKSAVKSLGRCNDRTRHSPYEQLPRQKPRPQPLTLTHVLNETQIGQLQTRPYPQQGSNN
jgi:hypothetical protein